MSVRHVWNPENQLSGYHWNNGLGYYQVNRDASTELFIDRMPKVHIRWSMKFI